AACPPELPVPHGMPCGSSAASACDAADTCEGQGVCLANHSPTGTPCPDDGNVCTDDVCDGTGTCRHIANGAECDDGDPCTPNDTCRDGVCVGTGTKACGVVGCSEAPDGTPCNDDNACTSPDTCHGGTCVGVPLNGTACDDGNACTENGQCAAG